MSSLDFRTARCRWKMRAVTETMLNYADFKHLMTFGRAMCSESLRVEMTNAEPDTADPYVIQHAMGLTPANENTPDKSL